MSESAPSLRRGPDKCLQTFKEAAILVSPPAWHVESGEGPSLASSQLCGPGEVINTSVNQALL